MLPGASWRRYPPTCSIMSAVSTSETSPALVLAQAAASQFVEPAVQALHPRSAV